MDDGLYVRSSAQEKEATRTRLFFFSSRRRHPRFDCDWSSDVCSSDLLACTEALGLRTEMLPLAERGTVEEYLKIIDTEVQRCRRIVDGLLDFSRPKGGLMRRVDVNEVVEQTLFLLKHHARFKRLGVVRELAPGLPQVLADSERLIQSFMALMLNAMDAMDSRGDRKSVV